MRKETIFLVPLAFGALGFLLGWLSMGTPPTRPAAPSLQAVAPPLSSPRAAVEPPANRAAAPATGEATGDAAQPGEAIVPPQRPDADAAGSPAVGPMDARVTIIEYSDFQCPYCRRVQPTLKRLLRERGDDVRLVWKNNPLSFHQRALPAAQAAYAAARQGRFWEYHDLLFRNQKALGDDDLLAYARELKLDIARFEKDRRDPALADQVRREQAAAQALGSRGTPAYFINGTPLTGARPYEDFLRAVEKAIEQADRAMEAGTPKAALHAALARQNHPSGERFVNMMVLGKLPKAAPRDAKPARKGRPIARTVWRAGVDADDPTKGPREALVTIVEFSDFECPFCSKVNPTLTRLLETFPTELRVVWKNNPLSFHKSAYGAAEAAMAAHAQGKFWEMHDLLFANQRQLGRADLERYAADLGLDMERFRRDLDTGAHRASVDADMELAQRVNARGTPNLFINGRQAVGARAYEDLEAVVLEELAKARKMVAAGVSPGSVYTQIMASGKVFEALASEAQRIDTKTAPGIGPEDAPVTIAVFSDFECPYCSRVGEPLKAVQQRFPKRVRLVFKHFPLSFHQQARLAAEASMAAHAQGKFWELHDLMFANQKKLQQADLVAYAQKLGLDAKRFEEELTAGEWKQRVEQDIREGGRAGVRGTPSVYINGRAFQPPGGLTVDALSDVLQKEFGL